MSDYKPTWDDIASAMIAVLQSVPSIKQASNGYPDKAISESSLVWAVIREPDIQPINFTFNAVTLRFTGQLNILIDTVNIDNPSLGALTINRCSAIGINISVELYKKDKRHLMIDGVQQVTHMQLSTIEIGRFSPYSSTNKFHYAGLAIPYQIDMQYRS